MGNPLSRYRPMPMEEPVITPDLSAKFPSQTIPSKKFFNNNQQKNIHKRKHTNKTPKRSNSNKFPSFPSLTNEKDDLKPLERFPASNNFHNNGGGRQRPGLSTQRGGNQRNKADNRKPQRPQKTTTPRPIPIPGKDFAFLIPHHVPSPQQPALPVHNPLSNYDRNYYDYEDTNEDDYDYTDDVDSFDNDDKSSSSVGFMQNGGFGPSWEPSKVTMRRRKREAAPQAEGRSAASSIFWHNGQPIQPRGNRNRSNSKSRRRNRKNVWGDRNHNGEVEEEDISYHIVRGNNGAGRVNGGVAGGYQKNNGGVGQSAADFWDDFNIHDPQSIYADKYSAQEEPFGNNNRGGGGGYHPQHHQPETTPSIESSWGQRQRPLNGNPGGSRNKYHRDPYPQQSIQDRYQGSGKERYGNEFYGGGGEPIYVEEKNEELGSGNFDVIQGGTFYDGQDAYYDDEYNDYNRQPNAHPQRYDSENNIANNFRDFADIKNDLGKYDQGYVPRYK